MSYIIDGADDVRWQGANWAFFKICEDLIPLLRNMSLKQKPATLLADRLEETLEIQIGYMDMRDIANDLTIAQIWIQAIEEIFSIFKEEDPSTWRRPEGFEPFLAKVDESKKLVKTPNSNIPGGLICRI